jgi:hypothetical protein
MGSVGPVTGSSGWSGGVGGVDMRILWGGVKTINSLLHERPRAYWE